MSELFLLIIFQVTLLNTHLFHFVVRILSSLTSLPPLYMNSEHFFHQTFWNTYCVPGLMVEVYLLQDSIASSCIFKKDPAVTYLWKHFAFTFTALPSQTLIVLIYYLFLIPRSRDFTFSPLL